MAELTERQRAVVPRPPVPGAEQTDEKVMPLLDHLAELRRRLFVGIVAVAFGSIVGWLLAPDAIRILKAPISEPLRFTTPGAALFIEVKLALVIGLLLGSPVVFYELWAFISPGLTARERRLARPWLPLALLFGIIGVATAYAILPVATSFLLGFQIPGVIEPLITADGYFSFVTMLFLSFGLVMQFPIVLFLLTKARIVSVDRLRRSRRYVLLGMFTMAVVVLPTGDPFSPTVMTLVMYPLYELTIWMAARSQRPAKRPAADG